MTLARIIVASDQLHRGRPFQRCCSHPPCRSHLRGLPIKHLLCRQRAAVTQNASSPSGMPWVLPPPCGGLMSEPRAVLPPAWASGRRPVQCSPSAVPPQRSEPAWPPKPWLCCSAPCSARLSSAAPLEADEQVVLWFKQFPGEREKKGGREEGGRSKRRKDYEYGKIWDNGKERTQRH